MKKSVLLGLSGGVDSAVTAALLLEEGYEVHGHWLDIGFGESEDAKAVAERLGIAFSVGDIRADLEEYVCKPFIEEYLTGKTPSPCARCNPKVKFPALFKKADELGIDFVATGHYANVNWEDGEAYLCRGELENDQSYMLARLPKDMLSRIIFPLGKYKKTEIRDLAHKFSIPVADKPDSMEICFVPDGDYAAWISRRENPPPQGNFVDKNGKILGTHKGIHHYTLGQRRGLAIAAGSRIFVSEIRPETNEVVLSDGKDLHENRFFCKELNIIAPMEEGEDILLRVRHSKNAYRAKIHFLEGAMAELVLEEAVRAPTPGQLAVFYGDAEGSTVLGSGWIMDK